MYVLPPQPTAPNHFSTFFANGADRMNKKIITKNMKNFPLQQKKIEKQIKIYVKTLRCNHFYPGTLTK